MTSLHFHSRIPILGNCFIFFKAGSHRHHVFINTVSGTNVLANMSCQILKFSAEACPCPPEGLEQTKSFGMVPWGTPNFRHIFKLQVLKLSGVTFFCCYDIVEKFSNAVFLRQIKLPIFQQQILESSVANSEVRP